MFLFKPKSVFCHRFFNLKKNYVRVLHFTFVKVLIKETNECISANLEERC